LDGRLVHVSGNATTEEVLRDGQFDIGRKALRLERQVEMFQRVERKESRTRDKLGDIRIQFRSVEPMTVSLLSKQKGIELEPFKKGIYFMFRRKKSAELPMAMLVE